MQLVSTRPLRGPKCASTDSWLALVLTSSPMSPPLRKEKKNQKEITSKDWLHAHTPAPAGLVIKGSTCGSAVEPSVAAEIAPLGFHALYQHVWIWQIR